MTKIKQGVSKATDWKNNTLGGGGIFVDIDTSEANFGNTPHYLTTLEWEKHHWNAGGINAIYNETSKSFRIYLKWVYKLEKPLTASIAEENGWYIKWTAIL